MNRLEHREIPLFWTFEELGPLRTSIEKWYSGGMPLSTIIKRSMAPRLAAGRRPLIAADIYAVLQDGIKKSAITQRFNTPTPEMPVATFRHFFAAFRDGGSLSVCMERVAKNIPATNAGELPSSAFIDYDVCNKLFRSMSERWRSECRGTAQALVKPRKEVLATRANMDKVLPHDKAMKIAQRVYDLVMAELCGGGPLELPETTNQLADSIEVERPQPPAAPEPEYVEPQDMEDTGQPEDEPVVLPVPTRLGPPPPPPLPTAEQQLAAGLAESIEELDIENLSDEDQLEPVVKGQPKPQPPPLPPAPPPSTANPFE